MKTERIPIRLHILSPTHIGCDIDYEPTGFVIRDGKLISFDPLVFLDTLSPAKREEFGKVCETQPLIGIYKFLAANYRTEMGGRKVAIAKGIATHYEKNIKTGSADTRAIINQFRIARTAFNPFDQKPIIPGTALKGSIRTAWLNFLRKGERTPPQAHNARELEQKLLLGGFDTDPLSLIRVSDLSPMDGVHTKVRYAVNLKKNKAHGDRPMLAEKSGAYQIFETLEHGSVFEGSILIDSPDAERHVRRPIKPGELFAEAHSHYWANFQAEYKYAKELGVQSLKMDGDLYDGLKKKFFFVRLGRHSGAEALTIEGHRSISIMQGPGRMPKPGASATTLWFTSEHSKASDGAEMHPFGWAALEIGM